MSFVFWLICLPFAQDAKNLESDKWQIRERAAHRLESRLPWSLPVLLTPSQTQNLAFLKRRIRNEHWLCYYLEKLNNSAECLVVELLNGGSVFINIDGTEYRVEVAHYFHLGNHRVVIGPRYYSDWFKPDGPRLLFEPQRNRGDK